MLVEKRKPTEKIIPYKSLRPDLIQNISLINKKNNKIHKADLNENSFSNDKLKSSFWIEGYGCSASYSDMEMICGQLQQEGYKLVDNPENASFNLIVTCSVKDITEHKMVHRIKDLSTTHKPLIVAGCLPSANKILVEKINPNASLMGPDSIHKTLEIVESTLDGQKVSMLQKSDIEKVNLPKYKINPIISIVQISTGCLSECTFCQTKVAKGNLQSYRIGEIIRQIRNDILNGSKEIWLSSTDNGCYGLDIGTNLTNLLYKCDEIDGDFKIRVGMMNPMYLSNKMIKDLVRFYTHSNKVFKFIHIPVQSGSENVLRAMKRGHTVKKFKSIVKKFREEIEKITIATDIITGFPTETDRDFQMTLDLLAETQPDVVNSSKYSSRPFTGASKLDKVESGKIAERSDKLHKLIKEISRKQNSKWINWEGEMLIDEIDKGMIKGRNVFYKSIALNSHIKNDIANEYPMMEIYGNNLSKQKKKQKTSFKHNPYSNRSFYNNNLDILGRSIRVKITGYSDHMLMGSIVSNKK